MSLYHVHTCAGVCFTTTTNRNIKGHHRRDSSSHHRERDDSGASQPASKKRRKSSDSDYGGGGGGSVAPPRTGSSNPSPRAHSTATLSKVELVFLPHPGDTSNIKELRHKYVYTESDPQLNPFRIPPPSLSFSGLFYRLFPASDCSVLPPE